MFMVSSPSRWGDSTPRFSRPLGPSRTGFAERQMIFGRLGHAYVTVRLNGPLVGIRWRVADGRPEPAAEAVKRKVFVRTNGARPLSPHRARDQCLAGGVASAGVQCRRACTGSA